MPGIGYITVMEDMSFKGPIDKFLTEEDKKNLIETNSLKAGSVLFFIADKDTKKCAKQAGLIRIYLGQKLELIDNNKFEFCIITDFPMYEFSEEEDKYVFTHNPFNMPTGGLKGLE